MRYIAHEFYATNLDCLLVLLWQFSFHLLVTQLTDLASPQKKKLGKKKLCDVELKSGCRVGGKNVGN